ncbi:MAG TPA: hypothetical protein VGV36_03755, partial [Solirubrobacteraceae bacterium]|nr:hypothetical protein [Solirubrobacteraceae bacterium]
LTEAAMRGALARAANFAKVSDKGTTHVAPPLKVVRDLLALGAWPFPALRGLIEAPALRPDGTIIDRLGYDAPTGLLYAPPPGAAAVRVATTPTHAQRRAARELLEEALEGFPFADNASRAGALALLLTPVVRPAINGQVPLALVDAPKGGNGEGTPPVCRRPGRHGPPSRDARRAAARRGVGQNPAVGSHGRRELRGAR